MSIFDDIFYERQRQIDLWSDEFDNRNTPNDWATYIIRYVSEGVYDGRHQLYTPQKNRECLVKAAAICVAAIEQLDMVGMAPRHYDRVEETI